MNWKYLLKIISVPLTLLAFYAIYVLLWKIFDLPADDEMVRIVKSTFEKYGLLLVFGASLIEGMLLAGNYFPGGLVIFLGVITAGKNIERVVAVVAAVTVAFFVAYTINYLLGRYGWYKLLVRFGLKGELQKSQAKLARHGLNAIILSYWQPNLAALTSTAAGVLGLNFRKFLLSSAVGIIIWNIFWGGLVYALGERALSIMHNFKYILLIVLVWIVIIVIREYYLHKKQKNNLVL